MATETGSANNDTIEGTPGVDLLYGLAGNDTLRGYAGEDSVYGGDDSDLIYGGDNQDQLYGDAGADTIYGSDGTGNATIRSFIYGGTGADLMYGDGAVAGTQFYAGADTDGDTIYSSANANFFDIGADDRIYAGGTYNILYGSENNIQLELVDVNLAIRNFFMRGDAEVIYGGAGQQGNFYTNDTLASVIYGGDGADYLFGDYNNSGPDIGFNDTLYGDAGNDKLFSGAGEDSVVGGGDSLVGGSGNDQYFLLDAGATLFEAADEGNDTVYYSQDYINATYGDTSRVLTTDDFDNVEAVIAYGRTTRDVDFVGSSRDESIEGIYGFVDIVYAGEGNDTISTYTANDTIYAGDGDDVIISTRGSADVIYGDAGTDTVSFNLNASDDASVTMSADGQGSFTYSSNPTPVNSFYGIESFQFFSADDTFYGAAGDQSVSGGLGAELIYGDAGNDTLDGGAGNDRLYGGDDNDSLIGSTGDDTIDGGAGNDSLDGGDNQDTYMFSDTLGAAFGDDSVSDSSGNDSLIFDAAFVDDLTVTLGAGAGAGTITSASGNVTLAADIENFTLGSGADSFDGTAVAGFGRFVDGGAGADTIVASSFNDTLIGGVGGDELYGGTGNDVFTISSDYLELLGDSIVGGDGDDTIDAGNVGNHMEVVYSGGDGTSGVLNFYSGTRDANGNFTGVLQGTASFSGIEAITPCFTPGALVATPRGPVPVEDLRPGDRVMTRDNGACEIAWAGRSPVSQADLAAKPRLRPVLIRAGALGNGLPERDMMLSPNHQVLMSGRRAQLYFAEHEVLLAAKHLVGRPGITRVLPESGVDYVHFMFERHEVVLADGVWSESFQPGDQSLAGLDEDQRHELLTLFPSLADAQGTANYTAARRILRRYEARVMLA